MQYNKSRILNVKKKFLGFFLVNNKEISGKDYAKSYNIGLDYNV